MEIGFTMFIRKVAVKVKKVALGVDWITVYLLTQLMKEAFGLVVIFVLNRAVSLSWAAIHERHLAVQRFLERKSEKLCHQL